MSVPYQVGEALPISLDPWRLPEYALRTVLRMAAALVASLVFSLAYAALAAKSRQRREDADPGARHPAVGADPRLPVDHRDRLHRALSGPPARLECAAIFAIFTSQAWNMTFSLYQSLRTVPLELTRGGADVPPVAVAALLAARSAVRDAAAGVEHDDVGVGRLVLRRRLGGDHASPARRSCCPASAPTSRPRSTSAISARSATPSWPCWSSSCSTTSCCSGRCSRGRSKFDGRGVGADEDDVRPWFLIMLQRARLFDLRRSRACWRSTARSITALAARRAASARRGAAAGAAASPLVERLFDIALLLLAGARRRCRIVDVHPREVGLARDRLGLRARA